MNIQQKRHILLNNEVAFDIDAQLLFSRWTNQVPVGYKAAMNTFIKQCKIDGNWSEMDAVWMPAQYDATNALKQLKSSSFTIGLVNAPAFKVGRGWIGNALTQYITTGYTPSSSGVKYTQNSASAGVYLNTNSNDGSCDLGVFNAAITFILTVFARNGGSFVPRVNDDGGYAGAAVADSLGTSFIIRTASNAMAIFKDGTSIGTSTEASTGLPDLELYLMARNRGGAVGDYSGRRLCFAFMGSGNVNLTLLDTAVKNYLKSIALLNSDVATWYVSNPTATVREIMSYYETLS